MRNERETTRPGQGRARCLSDVACGLTFISNPHGRSRILARRQYAGNRRPTWTLDRRTRPASNTDREDPTSPSFWGKRAPESEGYVGSGHGRTIPPITRSAQTAIA